MMLKRLALLATSLTLLTQCSHSETTANPVPADPDMARSEINVNPAIVPDEPVITAPYDATLDDPYTYFRKKKHPRSHGAVSHPRAKKAKHRRHKGMKKHKAPKRRPVQTND